MSQSMTFLQHPDLGVFEQLNTGIVLVDDTGRIVWANGAVQSMSERSLKSLQETALDTLFLDRRYVMRAVNALQNVPHISFEVLMHKGFDTIPVLVTLQISTQKPWHMLAEVHEVAQYLEAERTQSFDQQLQTYQESFYNLAHEVKNPLGGIRGAAQLLEMEFDQPTVREYTQIIIHEADRLQNLLDRLTESGGTSLHREPVNIHEVCEHVFSLIKAEYRDQVQVVRDYDASIPELLLDKNKIIQIYLNLARNAAQSLTENPPASRVPTMWLKTRVLHQQMIFNHMHRQVVALSLIDNGRGIPTALQHRVFHPLVTGRAKGTGLGLSLAQELARQHGGMIRCDSLDGHTEFELLLPFECYE